jgi:hypothetical protein
MFRIFYAEKDTTLYEAQPSYNMDLDEVLRNWKTFRYMEVHY